MSNNKDAFIVNGTAPEKPRGLLDAISEIQQYYVVERSGSPISEDFLSVKGKVQFTEIGFKAAVAGGLVSVLTTPLAIGVLKNIIPIFGTYNPSYYDQIFAILLSISYTIAYGKFLSKLGKYYIGQITKASIRNLLFGFGIGTLMVAVISFLFFHFLYFSVLTPETIVGVLRSIQIIFKNLPAEKLYYAIMEFKPVFLISAYFIVFNMVLLIAIPVTVISIQSRKIAKVMLREERYK